MRGKPPSLIWWVNTNPESTYSGPFSGGPDFRRETVVGVGVHLLVVGHIQDRVDRDEPTRRRGVGVCSDLGQSTGQDLEQGPVDHRHASGRRGVLSGNEISGAIHTL